MTASGKRSLTSTSMEVIEGLGDVDMADCRVLQSDEKVRFLRNGDIFNALAIDWIIKVKSLNGW